MRYLYLYAIVILIVLLAVAACGRKGEPRPPEKITKLQWRVMGQGSWGKFEISLTLDP